MDEVDERLGVQLGHVTPEGLGEGRVHALEITLRRDDQHVERNREEAITVSVRAALLGQVARDSDHADYLVTAADRRHPHVPEQAWRFGGKCRCWAASSLLGVAVGRRDDHGIAIRIADPELAVVCVRIAVHIEQDGRVELARTRHGDVEVVDFEPQQHAVADGACGVPHGSVVVIDLPRVQLQDQPVGAPLAGVVIRIPEPFVLGSSVTAHAAEESLVPAAGGRNVVAVDQGLGAHGRILTGLVDGAGGISISTLKLIWSPETADDFDQAITCLVSVDPVATAGRWGHAVTFFRDLMPILEAGHLPCGWQGRWPRGSLVVL